MKKGILCNYIFGTTFEKPYKLRPLINNKKEIIIVGIYDRIKTDEMGAVRGIVSMKN